MAAISQIHQAVAIARGFYLGDDPGEWTDADIASTADCLAEAIGLDADAIRTGLFVERAGSARRGGAIAWLVP